MMAILLGVAVLAVAVVLVAAGFIFVAARRLRPQLRARQQKISALCVQRGLVPSNASGDFPLLGSINPRWFTNHFASSDGTVAAADFDRPAGKQVEFFTLLAYRVSGLAVPYLAVARRDLLGITIGGPPEIELESTQFTEKFTVRAKDRRSAVMLLDPGMMQLVLDCGDVSFDMDGDRVLAYINRGHEPAHQAAEPVEFEVLFKFWDGFVQRLPELVRSEYAATR
jgi:hypothetical protein